MKLSIVTPNYNYGEFIGSTILSVINQDYKNLEYIIVDDGSTDNSRDIINDFYIENEKIITPIFQENRGQTPAINVGLKNITGDIVGWINSDDTYCENVFSVIMDEFISNSDIDIIFGDIYIVDVLGKRQYRKRYLSYNYCFGVFFGYTNIMSSNAVFFRKELISQAGFLNEELMCNMDGEFFSRLCRGAKVVKLNLPFANFRKQPYTKASREHDDWNKLVVREVSLEKVNSYHSLKISKFIPYKFSAIISIWLRIYRIILRMLHGHYMMSFLEKKKLLKP